GRADISNGGADATNETTNLSLTADMGFADLPPKDFEAGVLPPALAAALASQTFPTFGAQVFKIVASNDIHKVGDPTKKVELFDPQTEGIVGPPNANSVCHLKTIGAQSEATVTANESLRACFRARESGTRETLRETFFANTDGGHAMQATTVAPTLCGQASQA